jgi:hypothetical protein
MSYFSEQDVSYAMIIVTIVIIIFVLLRVNVCSYDLSGYWGCTKSGNFYNLRPLTRGTLAVTKQGKTIICRLSGLRGITCEAVSGDVSGAVSGTVEDKRRIIWDDGRKWVFQGVR